MDPPRRLVAISLAGFVMVGGAGAYAVRGTQEPLDPSVVACSAPSSTSVDRISLKDLDAVRSAVLADPLLARLTDVSRLAGTTSGKEPGVNVLPKAMELPGIGRTAGMVMITLPYDIPTGVQRFRITEQSGATDCNPPTSIWTREVEADVARLQGEMPRTLVAQVDLDPVRVIHLTPNVVDYEQYRRVGERTYILGGP
jgi:hypothetical protein